MDTEHAEAPARHRLLAALFGRQAGLYVLFILCMIGLYFFAWRGMRFFLVPSRSMEPALLPGDQIITLKEKEYQRGDIVVVDDKTAGYIVKRIIGLPGDRLEVQGGALYLNGAYVSEPYIMEPIAYVLAPAVTVPAGKVFLLGDNRNLSEDSHMDGRAWAMNAVIGRVVFTYYPYERWGPVAARDLKNIRQYAATP
jgi:signal peptidase I